MFICGIGGIGTSGLAILAKSCGYDVCGSNEEENSNTQKLRQLGFDVKIGHDAKNIGDCDVFVYTRAVDTSTNIEAIEAKAKCIQMHERGDMLAILMKHYFNIVIAGSHGKTTTTGLIGNMLSKLNEKPNILIGGVLNGCKTNCEISGKKYFVVESDESDGSFLSMPADIGIITNINPEHMEFYKTIENLEYYFYRFAKRIADKNGFAVICIDDDIGRNIINKIGKNSHILTYSATDKSADFYCDNIRLKKDGIVFNVHNNINDTVVIDVFLSNMFGEINALNSLPSFAVAHILNENVDTVMRSFGSFEGIQKRFTIVGKLNGTIVVDDYAHNPQKINSAIGSAKHYMKCNGLQGKLTVVFEPHRYTRVRDSINLFADVFKKVDNVIVLPIYASSEEPIQGITQEFVVKKFKEKNNSIYSCDLKINSIKEKLAESDAFGEQNLIIFMGAGRSSKLAHEIVDKENG